MMVLLSKREYDELVQKASATELIAERKAEAMKQQIKADVVKLMSRARSQHRLMDQHEFFSELKELLQHY